MADILPSPALGESLRFRVPGQRLPPASLEAEQALLGALLRNNKAYDRVAEFLRPEHFADAIHGRIYAAIAKRVDAGRLADAVTLRQEFEATGELGEVGGPAYLAQLLGAMVSIVSAGEYGRLVHDMYLRRQILDACEAAANAAHGEGDKDAAAIADRLDGALLALREGGAQRLKTMEEVARQSVASVAAAASRGGGVSGVTWGYRALDRMTGGMHPGQLIVLGARPSMGKTALSVGIATRAAAAGARTLYVSAEMLAEPVAQRVISAVTALPLDALMRGGRFDEEGHFLAFAPDGREMRAIGDAGRRISGLPILWDDAPSIPLPAIRARARGMRRKGGLDLIVVDYLGMLAPSSAAQRQNREYEIGELTGGLKALAKELSVPVLLLSQLNRGVEGREEKMPGLSDLRDSGRIEQDADVVGFIHRPHYYLTRTLPTRKGNETLDAFEARKAQWYLDCQAEEGKATILIAKQRQGPTGPVRLHFADHLTWFFNSAPSPEHGAEPAIPGLPE